MFKKILSVIITFTMIASMLFGCSTKNASSDVSANAEYADTVVYGTVYTAENQEVVEAFAVKDGKYIYVGDKSGASKYVKEGETEVIDKTGDYLITPGLTEGHGHFFGIDAVMKVLPGFYAQYDELLSIVDKKVKEEKIDKFFSYGLNVMGMALIDEDDRNYAEEIEKVAPGIPVVFVDNAAHQAICNVTALKMAGLWDKQDLRGGEYLYDKSGRINGVIRDQALPYVIDKVIGTMLTPDEYRKACQIAIDNLHDRGFTNFFDAWLNFADDSSLYKYIKEFDDAGKLNLNVGACYNIRSYESEKYKEVVDHVLDIADKYHSKHFNPYFIKLFADGVVESQTGWLIGEYPLAEEGHKHGNIIWDKEELKDVTKYANSKGILIHTHAYGDGACQAITEAYLKSNEELGKKYRNGLGHVRNILDEDKKRIGENGIALAENLLWHCVSNMPDEIKNLWPEGIMDNGYPMKSLLNNGIKVSSSTDSPCGEVIPGYAMNIIEVATTGKDYQTPEDPAYNTSELLTVKEALDCLTINGAWQLGLEEERGSIKVGKYADFSIMNKNILNYKGTQLETIHDGRITDIYFEGKNVFSKN